MKYLRDIAWDEVFAGWREREAGNPGWVKCATEIKGWPDWESWRKNTADFFGADGKTWKLYQFTDPMNEIPDMLVGPYNGWQSRFAEKNVHTFAELVEIPEQFEHFSKHEGIRSIIAGMPFDTQFIGLQRADNGKIVCVEGHHRATAFAILRKMAKQIDFSANKITIALAELGLEEIGRLEEVLAKGTSFNKAGS